MKYFRAALTALIALNSPPAAAHDHFAAGIVDAIANGVADAGEPLVLTGPSLTKRVFRLLARPLGQSCGGYYMLNENARTLFPLDSFSFTALSDGQTESGAINPAHTGSDIWMEITAVTGPAGGNFGFWETGRTAEGDTPTMSFPANQPTGSFAFPVSEPLPWLLPEEQDPYGHIHGRAWTADKPGDYVVSCRLVDRSATGPGGGPWHAPSQTHVFHYQAGPDFQPSVTLAGSGCVLTWPSQMGIWEPYQSGVVFQIFRGTNPASGNWTPIGSVTGTTAATATFTDSGPPAGKAFYRLSFGWSTR